MIYTIGTSNRSVNDFFDALTSRRVRHLVDVRSKPSSRFPQFRRPSLEKATAQYGLHYHWLGEVLGGLNDIATDHVDFRQALDRLIELEGEGPVAIFCSEADPAQCHRSWKVGAALLVNNGIVVRNILRDDADEKISCTLRRTRPIDIPQCVRQAALLASAEASLDKGETSSAPPSGSHADSGRA